MKSFNNNLRVPFLILFLFTLQKVSIAQIEHEEFKRYKDKYPEKSVVIPNKNTTTTIDFDKNGNIFIITKEEEEKIYLNKFATSSATQSVISTYFEELIDIEAVVYDPISEKKYKKIKVKDFEKKKVLGNNFYDDIHKTTFTFPTMHKGVKTYISNTSKTTYPQFLSGVYFGNFTNIEQQTFQLRTHKDIELHIPTFNGLDTLVTYSKTIDGDYINHLWKAKDIPEMEYESSSPSYLSLVPHVYPIIKSYTFKGKKTPLLGTVKDLHNWYSELINKMKTPETKQLKSVIDSLITPTDTELEKVEKIFLWVQKNIKYVAYEYGLGGFVPRPADLVYERKYGDCKDVSSLQVTLMELAGVKGHMAWVGTRSKPYSYSELPSPGCDNHMIASYKDKIQNKWYFLDATGTYGAFGYPSSFIQGKEVMVHLSDTEYEIVKVDYVPEGQNLTRDSVYVKIIGKDLVGHGRKYISGFPYSSLKYAVLNIDSTQLKQRLKSFSRKGSNKFFFTLDSTNFEKLESGYYDYSFEIKDYIKENGNEFYLNLNLEKLWSQNKIEDDRKLPFEMDYKTRDEFIFVLEQGNYNVKLLPKNSKFDSPNYNYKIEYEQKDKYVIYNMTAENLNLLLEPKDFPEWNNLVKKLNRAYRESIILNKE